MDNLKYRAFYKCHEIMCDVAVINFYHKNVVLLAVNEEQEKLFTKLNREVYIQSRNLLSAPIYDCELMQCTGLKDKNDKEIYKGDILKDTLSERWYTVDFDLGSFALRERDATGTELTMNDVKIEGNNLLVFEVIGNVFETDREILD